MFKILNKSSKTKARTGIITTPHGEVKTPCFYPDATYGAVKYLSASECKKVGLEMVLGNVYHLGLRPGPQIIKDSGGLHKFMNWDRPILTDSGGFQAFSLVHQNGLGEVLEDGVLFSDHINGAKHLLTPEKSIQMQFDMNSDILMSFDDCIFSGEDHNTNVKSVELTTKWGKTSIDKFKSLVDTNESIRKQIFGIIQGGADKELRKRSANELLELNYDGYGYGGWTSDHDGKMLF